MVDMARVWPIVCQYGFGAILGAIGIWCGISSGYLDPRDRSDRLTLILLIAGYLAFLALVCVFTFQAPFWGPFTGKGATP